MLYGVSVGPGDPELLTLKAARILKHCPVIAYPCTAPGSPSVAWEIALAALPDLVQKQQLPLTLPMTRDAEKLKQARTGAAMLLTSVLETGQDVALLTLGDASVYSTCIYLHERVSAAGYESQIIPGVPSFCAAAALRGGHLTHAEKPFHIVPGSYGHIEESLSWPGPKIFMKTGKALGEVKATLDKAGLLDKAFLVQECGMPGQMAKPLAKVEEAGYFSIIFVEDKE